MVSSSDEDGEWVQAKMNVYAAAKETSILVV